MIRMIPSTSSAHAKAYFSEALQKSDYYLDDQELRGKFHGLLAERIGLDGYATKDKFFALCENRNPLTGSSLTPRTKQERRVGYDINYHVPKSVSIIHALSGDAHILEAFETSVSDTMKDMERDMMTRIRKGGAYDHRVTGELLYASFTHQTARPVEGNLPDPHLHAHCFVWNATWDEKEDRVKAGEFGNIMLNLPYYQARFHKSLSDKLIDLGYAVRRTDQSFEIVGVPKKVIDLFSKRTNEIGQVALEKGIYDAKAKSELGARTRAKKQKGLTMAELKKGWRQQIQLEAESQPNENVPPVRFAPVAEPEKVIAQDCIDFATQHCLERASVIQDRRLLAIAYKHSIGRKSISLSAISESFVKDSRFIHVKDKHKIMCTTKNVLFEEKRMVELAKQGQGRFSPLYLNFENFDNLNDQQNLAVRHVLTTTNQVSIVRGAAGVGKTTLMKPAIQMIEKLGKKVIIVAPTAEASRGVLVRDGFDEAQTVAKLLIDKDLQNNLKNGVLWVDEAGLLGTKDMTALLNIATQNNARLILGGDTRQHASVVRGDALRILNTVAGIKTAEVNKIVRQKDVHYKEAVSDLSKGNVQSAFIKLSSIGAIKNVDPIKPNETLVDDYMQLARKGKNILVVSPTHKQGNAVTDDIREKLKAAGLLGKKEIVASKLVNTNFTEAEKSDWRSFEPGQIIQLSQNVPHMQRGSRWLVKSKNQDQVEVIDQKGEIQTLPLNKPGSYEVYQANEIKLAKGDKVKITRNSFDQNERRMNNGQTLKVLSVSKNGKLVLENDVSRCTYQVEKDFGHISHAYCTTSHSAQGKTVDHVLISQPSATFGATNAKQFYVSVSRGKEAATVYTDDQVALLKYASEIGNRQSALELIASGNKAKDAVIQQERNAYGQEDFQQKKAKKEMSNKLNLYDDYGL